MGADERAQAAEQDMARTSMDWLMLRVAGVRCSRCSSRRARPRTRQRSDGEGEELVSGTR